MKGPAMQFLASRRQFLGATLSATGAALAAGRLQAADPPGKDTGLDFPLVDYHVHRDNTTVDKLLEISRRRGVKFGIVEHAGGKENKYPIVLSNDDELKAYIASLDGKPVYKGVQAEWIDWMTFFSRDVIAQLDYVLTDAWTVRGPDGKRQKMWEGGFTVGEKQKFMDTFVDFHVEIMSTEPIDILANPTWLPGAITKEHDELWTTARMQKVIDAAVKYIVAIEINSQYRLPRMAFLKLAKEAGVKFSFGTNIRGPEVGKLDWSIDTAKKLGLTRKNMFTPAPPGKKPVERRK
jgi:histidinol phosphatase-like PHP family hydrolase